MKVVYAVPHAEPVNADRRLNMEEDKKSINDAMIGTKQEDVEAIAKSSTPYQDTVSNTNLHRQISQDINVLVNLFHGANREANWWDKTTEQKDAEKLCKALFENDDGDNTMPIDETIKFLNKVVAKERDPLTMQILMISEIIEAMEGIRKNLMDDHLPHRSMEEVEMADVFLRLVDYCGGRNIDLGNAVCEKATYNIVRADHKKENRDKENGKKF